MAGDVTLTASMRSNLYSLQQTAQLMGTVQQRLATGKKVNSALDNPSNYFTAQSLSNRASDIGSLLDGMGQAIQAIKMATQGIEGAQKLIDQMKSVANSALQTATSSSNGPRTAESVVGVRDTQKLITEDDSTQLLTNLKNNTTGLAMGIAVNDTLVATFTTGGAAVTFTVGENSTVKDLTDWMEQQTGGAVTVTSGVMDFVSGAKSLTFSGNLASAGTGFNIAGALTASQTVTSTVTAATGPTMLAALSTGGAADDSMSLLSLTDSNGVGLGVALGDTLTLKIGPSGNTVTFTVGGDNKGTTSGSNQFKAGENGGGLTLNDLQSWIEKQGDGTGDFDLTITAGKVSLANSTTVALATTVDGGLAQALGIKGTATSGGSVTGSTAIYATPQYSAPVVTEKTLLRDITTANGNLISNGQLQVGDGITVKNSTGGLSTIKITDGMTVGNLLTQLNNIDSNLKVSLNTNGQFVVDNQTSGTVTFYNDAAGSTASGLFVNPGTGNSAFATNAPGAQVTSTLSMHAGWSATGSGASGSSMIDANKSSQFDTLRTQLDELVADAGYQGTNLISGANNSPLTVTFNEKATGASKLVITAVDLTTTGLSLKAATGTGVGAWQNADAVRDALASLTAAATTLRNQAATLGYNLSTVQNRQDFANNMISTLKEGADKLTLADMNEEGANMLALQTRSQLGTQSLSLASQANQSVMRLFG